MSQGGYGRNDGGGHPIDSSRPVLDTRDWTVGSDLNRSNSCSSLDIPANLYSSLGTLERTNSNVNHLNSMDAPIRNRIMDSNRHLNFSGQNTFSDTGIGFESREAAPLPEGIHQQGRHNDGFDDVRRYLSSGFSNRNLLDPPSLGSNAPSNHLEGLAAQFHQIQRQIQMQRQLELHQLMLLQHDQQQQQFNNSSNSTNLAFEPAFALQPNGNSFCSSSINCLQDWRPQEQRNELSRMNSTWSGQPYVPVSFRRSQTRSSQGSISSLSVYPSENDKVNISTIGMMEENRRRSFPSDGTQQTHEKIKNDNDQVLFVPTKDHSPSSLAKSYDGETNSLKSELVPPTVVTANTGEFRQRTSSISSFDALLSAFGEDLAELKKESNDLNKYIKRDDNKRTWNSSTFSTSDDHITMHHLYGIFGNGDIVPSNSGISMMDPQGISPRQTWVVPDLGTRNFMSQTNPPMLARLTETNLTAQAADEVQEQVSASSSCAIESAMKRLSSALKENPYVHTGSDDIPPEESRKQLDIFLAQYGEEGENARDRMLKAIEHTEASLAKIHAWDRTLGLRKCHNRTVVKTRRTRAQIKAFLMGVNPPKEPKQRRNKQKSG
ncbi:hypothetical protein ACHAW6_007902 [Cyclotella cf. meneghiniana]